MTRFLNDTVAVASLSRARTMRHLSTLSFLQNIAPLADWKFIFTSLALALLLVFLIVQLDRHNRRHLRNLAARHQALSLKLSAFQQEISDLQHERERREVVLRVETGKAREEIMSLRHELDERQSRLEREREVDRNVDMEEKLCLIRGMKELAAMRDTESAAGDEIGEMLRGLGADFGSGSFDQCDEGVSESSADEEEVERLKRESQEAWEKFDESCQSLGSELKSRRIGEPSSISSKTENFERQREPTPDFLAQLDEISDSDEPTTPETQGDRLFPPQQMLPLLGRRRKLQRSFTDPGVEAQLTNIFELE